MSIINAKSTSIALLVAFLSNPVSFAETMDRPVIFPMKSWFSEARRGKNVEKLITFNARIKNSTNEVLCVLNTYFPYVTPQYRWIYNLRDEQGKKVRYIGIIGEEGFPQNPYRILPPGETIDGFVDLSELYEMKKGRYSMRFTLFVPYCNAFKNGYFPIPSPQDIGWERGQIPPEAVPVRDKGVFFDSGHVEFEVK